MRAVHATLPSDDLRWGLRRFRTADVPIWLLANPSGLDRCFSLDVLFAAYAELRRHVAPG
jgi:G:T/U-mismatch repair DNA glycosylase